MCALLIGIAVFALQVGVYALLKRRAANRAAQGRLQRAISNTIHRPRAYVATAHNTPGDN